MGVVIEMCEMPWGSIFDLSYHTEIIRSAKKYIKAVEMQMEGDDGSSFSGESRRRAGCT